MDRRARRILATAERLFAEKGFDNVTVRDIATKARVTHPLIYYYWGSKRGLLAAVVERNQARMRRAADGAAEPEALIAGLVRENLAGSRLYLLTLLRALLDGMKPADWPGGFPAIEAALEALVRASSSASQGDDQRQAADRERREVLMVIVAMLNGWVLLEEPLLSMVGLPAADRDHARETLLQGIETVLRLALPDDGAASS